MLSAAFTIVPESVSEPLKYWPGPTATGSAGPEYENCPTDGEMDTTTIVFVGSAFPKYTVVGALVLPTDCDGKLTLVG